MPARNLTVRFLGDDTSLRRAQARASRGLDQLRRQMGRLRVGTGALVGAIGGLAGAAGLIALANRSRQNIDAQAKLATNIGGTIAQVQVLDFAASQSGTKMEVMTKAAQKLAEVLGQAERGMKGAQDALDDLGISSVAFRSMTPLQRLVHMGDALLDVENKLVQADLGTKLLGRGWREMLAVFQSGAIETAAARFNELGLALDEASKANVERFNDQLDQLGRTVDSVGDHTFAQLSKPMGEILQHVNDTVDAFILANGGAEVLGATITTKVLTAIQDAAAGVAQMNKDMRTLSKWLGPVFGALGTGFDKGTYFVGGALAAGAFASEGRGDLAADAIVDALRRAGALRWTESTLEERAAAAGLLEVEAPELEVLEREQLDALRDIHGVIRGSFTPTVQ